MSKYTTEVRYICEEKAGLLESSGFNDVSRVVELARDKVFNFDFPIYDEAYRSVLETKILKHFYTREIGAESVGLWQLWLDTRLNEIMPYYNKLYESALIEFNPLYDVDLYTKKDGTYKGNRADSGSKSDSYSNESEKSGSGSSNSSGSDSRSSSGSSHEGRSEALVDTAWKYYSDTPQGGVDGLDTMTYLTNATKDTDNRTVQGESTVTNSNNESGENSVTGSTTNHENLENSGRSSGTTSNNSNFNNTEDYLEHVAGKRGGVSYSKMLKEYRDTFLNIDLMVIHELDDLFLNLW